MQATQNAIELDSSPAVNPLKLSYGPGRRPLAPITHTSALVSVHVGLQRLTESKKKYYSDEWGVLFVHHGLNKKSFSLLDPPCLISAHIFQSPHPNF